MEMKIALGVLVLVVIGLAVAIGPDTIRYIKISRM
jgi:hypothetical protein